MEHPHIPGLSEWRALARGGLAVVWEARQLSLDRLVAVKVYQSELNEGDRRRIRREAAAAGRLSDHPAIVTAYDAGILPDDRPYLMMKLCRGGSLTPWLTPENRPSEERVLQVGVRMADALAFAHAHGVLHRDVKPAHILLDVYGNPGLVDFGLAVVAGAEAAAADALLPATPAYAPPEALGMQPATESGDVFSLAATLYALLAGIPPRSVGATVTPEQTIEVARPIGPLPWVNWFLMDVLLTALSIDPAARPTAARLRDQLASMPAPHIPKRGPPVGAAKTAPSRSARERSVAPGHPAMASSHSVAGALGTADSQGAPDHVASAKAPRWRGRRVGFLALAAALVTVITSATIWLISEPASSGGPAATTQSVISGELSSSAGPSRASDPGQLTSTMTPGANAGSASAAAIQLKDPVGSAKPFQTVPIQGTYRGGADTFLRVQRWEAGRWLAFPLATKTDRSGQFTAYVELGRPGHYRLRVLDPDSDVASEPFVLAVKG